MWRALNKSRALAALAVSAVPPTFGPGDDPSPALNLAGLRSPAELPPKSFQETTAAQLINKGYAGSNALVPRHSDKAKLHDLLRIRVFGDRLASFCQIV